VGAIQDKMLVHSQPVEIDEFGDAAKYHKHGHGEIHHATAENKLAR